MIRNLNQHIITYRLFLAILVVIGCIPAYLRAQDTIRIEAQNVREVEVERLADLHIPRATLSTLYINGEYVVFGGHTTGFIPTPTAEYYRDGRWHVMDMVYSHDGGMALPLKSGQVLLAGGFEKYLGIGQTYVVERYDPVTHQFHGFGCLNHKRAMASGVELDSGRVIISGNWYGDDAIEQFDGHNTFTFLQPSSSQRCNPFMLRISRDNVLIFSSFDTRGKSFTDKIIVDQLKGDPFSVPLFDDWKPLPYTEQNMNSDNWFIGDEQKGHYAYLVPVVSTDGRMGLAHVEDTTFTLLPTAQPIPNYAHGKQILYRHMMVVDRTIQRAYLIGYADYRCYCVGVDYGKRPSPVTVWSTDSIPFHGSSVTLTPDGDILLVGGIKPDEFNFTPVSTTCLLKVGRHPTEACAHSNLWIWLGAAIVMLAILFYGLYVRRKNRSASEPDEEPQDVSVKPHQISDDELIKMICDLMDQQKIYLNSDLKLSDLSQQVHINKRYVSDCIKRKRGCSFSQFVNTYRINYAKQLLLNNRDEKISVVSIRSGFANETSFFRTFKSITGLTPREWLTAQND